MHLNPTAELHVEGPTYGRRLGAPVFIVGCVRPGTTLLYHMLLITGSCGGWVRRLPH